MSVSCFGCYVRETRADSRAASILLVVFTRAAPRTHSRIAAIYIARNGYPGIGNNSCRGRFKERITGKISKKIWSSLKCLPFKYYNAGQYCSSRRRGEIEKWLVKHETLATPVDSVRSSFSVRLKKEREKEEREERDLRNNFPRILPLKRSYLGGFLLYFHISNFNPGIHGRTITDAARRNRKRRRRAIHICRSEIRTPPPSIPRLEVIITYIRQLTRVRPCSRHLGNPRSPRNCKQFRIQYRAAPTLSARLW